MGVFDSIKDAIFGRAEAAETPTTTTPPPAASAPAPTPTAGPASTPKASPPPAPQSAPPAPQSRLPASAPVDVTAVMEAAVKASGQKLNWKTSIVDTMKALGLDSSLANRKELAKELGYTGDTSDSATMNVWLQKALMKKIGENGGKVPADLTD